MCVRTYTHFRVVVTSTFDRYMYICVIARNALPHFDHTSRAIMVKLTTDVIEKKCSQILIAKSLSKTMKKEELWKLTHLHMNDMFISSIVSYVGALDESCDRYLT